MVETEGETDVPYVNDSKTYPEITQNPLDEISLTAYALGGLGGLFLGLIPVLKFTNFNIYMIAFSLFHFLEFYTTAKYNPSKVSSDSFILNNGIEYTAAHLLGVFECFIEGYFFKSSKALTPVKIVISCIAIMLIIIGQLTRSIAMCTAGKSFSHFIKTEKETDHVLVKDGIYAYLRHPSYFGFYWWAVGTQLLLLNPISTVVFLYVLWAFFRKRINIEERYLISFFGKDYVQYKKEVSTRIPFIE
ncbi:hypothetical protein NCAS_0A12100 [Naumovozyma castellii]|uniref:Protein-S-isoprenylcysteine O-methyltransferase n=1 Tax=Naumovozyma castellii TaxID=27288 RepID=G0V8H0_NAUCA|nr:hypothetical protein NCAS_0A12100 [Naumovozyma castellii CBS 4309]CCC67768.1 hypothetical protein NCAS_0A12100 [Naumovozyma castellii CBS 4309]